jgi:hypothetical protein
MFESFFMQTGADAFTTSLTSLIVTIGTLATAVGGIMHSLANSRELTKHRAALESASDFLDDVGNHVVQSKADIATLAKVTYDMLPEKAEQIVNAQNVRLDNLNQKLQQAQKEISSIPPALDHL